MTLSIEYVDADSLVAYDRNSRTHSDQQVEQVARSIEKFGFTNPILIDDSGVIIAGHGRLMAAKNLGMDSVPTIKLSHLSDEERRAYVIADNKLAEQAGWDEDLLRLEMGELESAGFDMSLIGFDDKELASLLEAAPLPGLTGDDDVPEMAPIVTSKHGDIWLLGDHRVMCGDSTIIEHMRALCPSQVDMVWTDPPYNVAYESSDGKKIANDSMADDKFFDFLTGLFTSAFEVTRAGGGIYVAHADSEGINFRRAAIESGFDLKQCLIWVKNTFALGRQDYQWQHEPILYGWKPGAAHRWFGARDKRTVIDDQTDIAKMGTQELRDLVYLMRNQDNTSVIYEAKPQKSAEHPTMKPVRLIEHMVKNSSRRGDAVLDVCGGSGSTLIACEKLGRQARLMEFDPAYCDVIIRRWQDYTGKKATLESSGKEFDHCETRALEAA